MRHNLSKLTIFVAVALLAFGTAAFAQPAHQLLDSPVAGVPAFAPGDVLDSVPHAGASPLGITQNTTNGDIYVADLFSGSFHQYDADLNFIATFAHPHGAATTTGIAYRESSDSLFILNADTSQLIETDLTGVAIGAAFAIANPGAGLLAGVSHDDQGTDSAPSFWYVDIANDEAIESDEAGAFKSQFNHPLDVPDGTGAFGNGLDVTNSDAACMGPGFIDILGGAIGAGQVTESTITDKVGAVQGLTDVTTTGDTFVNDVVRDTDYLGGGLQAIYIVGNSSNTIFALEATPVAIETDCDDIVSPDFDPTVPTLNTVGLAMLILLLGGAAAFMIRRKA